jgi:hypothetical protein
MVHLMDYKHSSKVMDELRAFILAIPQVDRCTNEEVEEWTTKFKNILSVFDGIFSIPRSVSPKPHALEDHLVDQLICFSGDLHS